MSDHLPLITMPCQTRLLNKTPLTFESRCLTEDKLAKVRDHLYNKDWVGLLNDTTTENFDILSQIVNEELDNVSPKQTITISAKCRFTEQWMTKGLEKALTIKMKLYKATLKPSHTEEDIAKYKTHQNLYNSLKRTAKMTYYCEKCSQFKQNTQKLWGIINETIKQVKHCGSIIPYIAVNGIRINRAKDIANSFGKFYSQLGSELASKILPGTTMIDDYISHIPWQLSSFVMRFTTIPEIEQLINRLPNKSSHGHDNLIPLVQNT